MLNRLLSVSDVSADAWTGNIDAIPSWACQAVMNLETVGLIQTDAKGWVVLSDTMTRSDAAQMLSSALDLIKARENNESWFNW